MTGGEPPAGRVAARPAPGYRSGVRGVLLALLVAAAPGGPRAAPRAVGPQDVERRREQIARELVRLGAGLEREIVARDVGALVARVPAAGLRCGGRVVPRAKVARDLASAGSWLHDVFFGGPAYAPPPGAPRSLAELLRTGGEVAVLVSFQPDARAGPAGRPCIDFRVKDTVTPGAPLCFEQRDGRWWFTESLYPCG